MTTALDSALIESLKQNFSGRLIQPGDGDYDETRQIWNAMIDKRPALIARCKTADDVVAAVKFGREQRLLVAVRGAGHNIAGNAVCDDGLMIDLSQMNNVRVDASAKRAFVEAGATLADVDGATQAHGLAVPLGINSTTGIAGLTLGGGFGWTSRKLGLTADSLVAADVVLADGSRVRASEDENADLFWGLRGGSGNFGVVTEFEFKLSPLGPELLSGLIVFPLDQAKEALRKYVPYSKTLPDELSVWAVLRQAPPLPFLPENVHLKSAIIFAICHAGDPSEGEKLIEPIRAWGEPFGEHVGVQPYIAWQQALDPLLAPGSRNYWKSHNFNDISDGAIDALVDKAGEIPGFGCEIILVAMGGATSKLPSDAIAYPHRDTNYIVNVHGRWDSPEEDEAGIAWTRGVFEAARPFASGSVYVNFMPEDEQDRVATGAYGPNYERLRELKRKYDPDNFFSLNQNIKP